MFAKPTEMGRWQVCECPLHTTSHKIVGYSERNHWEKKQKKNNALTNFDIQACRSYVLLMLLSPHPTLLPAYCAYCPPSPLFCWLSHAPVRVSCWLFAPASPTAAAA